MNSPNTEVEHVGSEAFQTTDVNWSWQFVC